MRRDTETCDDPIPNPKVGSALPSAIENQQLMSDQCGFSNHGTEPARPRKSNYGDDHMKKKGENVAHGGMVSNLKNPAFRAIEEFAMHKRLSLDCATFE